MNYLEPKRNLENSGPSCDNLCISAGDCCANQYPDRWGTGDHLQFALLASNRDDRRRAQTLSGPAKQIEVVDSKGQRTEYQLLSLEAGTNRVQARILARVPAFGIRAPSETVGLLDYNGRLMQVVKASADTLENEFIRVKIDPQSGCMTSVFDKKGGTEGRPCRDRHWWSKRQSAATLLQTFVDKPKQWDAWNSRRGFRETTSGSRKSR